MTKSSLKYNKKELLEMDPEDLLDYIVSKTKVKIPMQLTPENQAQAAIELSKAAQYELAMAELCDRADLIKRKLKIAGDKEGAALMQMRENVLKGQASRLKRSCETISRLFTIKNQELQELRLLNITS